MSPPPHGLSPPHHHPPPPPPIMENYHYQQQQQQAAESYPQSSSQQSAGEYHPPTPAPTATSAHPGTPQSTGGEEEPTNNGTDSPSYSAATTNNWPYNTTQSELELNLETNLDTFPLKMEEDSFPYYAEGSVDFSIPQGPQVVDSIHQTSAVGPHSHAPQMSTSQFTANWSQVR